MANDPEEGIYNRRNFLAGGVSIAALVLAAEEAEAQARRRTPARPPARPPAKPAPKPANTDAYGEKKAPVNVAPVTLGVIGLGDQGKQILASLARVPGANVAGICDHYKSPVFLKRAQEAAPKARFVEDYRALLDRSDIQAVVVATPTHLHKDIVLAALQAGKHVYCEAPLAHTVEEARTIARAGAAAKTLFQVGMQNRANGQHHHVQKFIAIGALDRHVGGRAQWNRKMSWRRSAPTDERQNELNWRLQPDISLGLIGELGIHSIDVASWFWKGLPVSATGFGSVLYYQDGREVADSVQCVIEYPGGLRFTFTSTLGNSFEGSYELFQGSHAAVLLRDQRAWMFKEADSPLLGWEVYARKEEWGDETGIALVADASKQLKEGRIPGKTKQVLDPGKTTLYYSLESFCNCIREKKEPDCGAQQGFEATVTAIACNQAVRKNGTVQFQKDWFAL